MAVSDNTSITLLERIRDPGNHDAWERFAAFCQPVICRYARRLGCNAAMCQDVVQETLVDLVRIMATFRYDPAHGRFRSFLYQIVRRRVCNAWRRQARYQTLDPSDLAGHAVAPEQRPDSWETEWQRQVAIEALELLRQRVEATSFEAFHADIVLGEPVANICARLDLQPNAFYQIRHRLGAALRRIVVSIESDVEVPHGP